MPHFFAVMEPDPVRDMSLPDLASVQMHAELVVDPATALAPMDTTLLLLWLTIGMKIVRFGWVTKASTKPELPAFAP